MKIKSVTIQGMHNIDTKTYELNDINYLYGPNGAGKSTALEAIQLAILGYIPGYAKTKGSIISHRNGNQAMSVKVIFDDDTSITRTWSGAAGTLKIDNNTPYNDTLELVGDLELPIFNFGELSTLTANKLKDWFIQFLPSVDEDIDWESELKDAIVDKNILSPEVLEETLDKIESLKSTTSSQLDLVRTLNEDFKQELSYYKKEIDSFSSTVQSLIYYDEDEVTGDDEYINSQITECQNNITAWTREKEQMLLDRQVVQSNQSIKSQLATLPQPEENYKKERLETEIKALQEEIVKIQAEEVNLRPQQEKLIKSIPAIEAEIQRLQQVIDGDGICPYTSETCGTMCNLIEDFKTEISDNKYELLDLKSELEELSNEITAKSDKVTQIQKAIQQKEQTIQYNDSLAARKQQLEGLLKPESDMSKYHDEAYYVDDINEARNRITKLEANKKYNELIDKFTAQKFKTENLVEVYKIWAKLTDANGLQSRIMNQAFLNFADEMDKFIVDLFPGDVKCGFDLQEKANTFSFGIIRNNQYIKYELLSSGEKTIYTLAMMLCIIDKSDSQLKVLIIDDMLDHLDDARANLVFEGMSHINDIQIIAAGVKGSDNLPSYVIEV